MVVEQSQNTGLIQKRRGVFAAWTSGFFLLCTLTSFGLPVITGFAPTLGAPGTSILIAGSGFATTLEVRFGDALAIFTVDSDTSLVATVPLDGTTGPITIGTSNGSAVSSQFFTVAPRITDFTPTQGPAGAVILVTGNNFEGATAVQFNGSNAVFAVTGPTQLQAVVPAGATNGPITISTAAGTAVSPAAFIVTGLQPFIDSFTPTNGAPNAIITIGGLNFTGATSVAFNGTNLANFRVTAPTQIQAQVPAAAGTGPISVTTPLGTGVSAASFLVTTAPIITDFAPLGGPEGTDVTITGDNFLGATGVQFAGKAAAGFAVTATTQMHAIVPSGATNGPISVTTPLGTGSSLGSFFASAGPLISDFFPTNGPPQTVVAIDGINLATVTAVQFGGANAQFQASAPTQILALVPANATNGPITVISPSGTATSVDPFLLRSGKPILLEFEPQAGLPRTIVTIEGLDLSNTTAVQFNGTNASFSVVADTQISALVPDNATTGPITITTPAGSTVSSLPFVVAPRISSFAPGTGAAGTLVTLQGTNFSNLVAVRFNGTAAQFTNSSPSAITAVVPDEATSGSISVTSPGGIVASTNLFLVLPRLTRFTPTSGPIGTSISIFGTGFGNVTSLQVGGINAANFSVLSATQIVAIVPPLAVSGLVTVTTATGSASSVGPFIVGPAANLSVSQSASTNQALVNQLLTIMLTLTNRGPSAATGVVLSNTLPAQFFLLSATASSGILSRTSNALRVDIASLASGATSTLNLTVLPALPGSATNVATVSASELDPDPSDNAGLLTTLILSNSAVLNLEQLSPTQMRLSWPLTATNFVLQSTGTFPSGQSWQTVSTQPTVVGNQKFLILPSSLGPRFFRLNRP